MVRPDGRLRPRGQQIAHDGDGPEQYHDRPAGDDPRLLRRLDVTQVVAVDRDLDQRAAEQDQQDVLGFAFHAASKVDEGRPATRAGERGGGSPGTRPAPAPGIDSGWPPNPASPTPTGDSRSAEDSRPTPEH